MLKHFSKNQNNTDNALQTFATKAELDIVLVSGAIVNQGNFELVKKIESLNEFWDILKKDKSFFARHRVYPTAFFLSWQIRSVFTWIDAGYFWTVKSTK